MNPDYSVFILYDGYSSLDPLTKIMTANCTCTLIKGPKNIIVDTMTAWDGDKILNGLAKYQILPEMIDYVVCTHGHSDHIGNNNLFLKAMHIVGESVSRENKYFSDAFEHEKPFIIDEHVKVIRTPGHTMSDVTVLVNSKENIYAVAGDLFENENDVDDPNIWMEAGSESINLQLTNRLEVAKIADWIIPGHGKIFKSDQSVREKLCKQANSLRQDS